MVEIAETRPSVSITRARETDIKKLIAIEQSVSGNPHYSPMLTEEEWVHEIKTHDVFLIKLGRRVVGNLSYERASADRVYISGLVVMPEHQRQGVAREAMQIVLKDLEGVARLDLVTHPKNPALHLYKSLGFTEEALHENFYGDGEPRIVLVLERI
jgi:[ribosomal protein S18]-alanine N-acetyltransferase